MLNKQAVSLQFKCAVSTLPHRKCLSAIWVESSRKQCYAFSKTWDFQPSVECGKWLSCSGCSFNEMGRTPTQEICLNGKTTYQGWESWAQIDQLYSPKKTSQQHVEADLRKCTQWVLMRCSVLFCLHLQLVKGLQKLRMKNCCSHGGGDFYREEMFSKPQQIW